MYQTLSNDFPPLAFSLEFFTLLLNLLKTLYWKALSLTFIICLVSVFIIPFSSCEQPILWNANFCLFTFWEFLPDKIVKYQQLHCHFLIYFYLNSKLLPGKSTQKMNKQKIRCKNSGFVLVVHTSWTRWIIRMINLLIIYFHESWMYESSWKNHNIFFGLLFY